MEGGLVAWLLGTARPAAVTGHSAHPTPHRTTSILWKTGFEKIFPQTDPTVGNTLLYVGGEMANRNHCTLSVKNKIPLSSITDGKPRNR